MVSANSRSMSKSLPSKSEYVFLYFLKTIRELEIKNFRSRVILYPEVLSAIFNAS